jgi:hypothetical protein
MMSCAIPEDLADWIAGGCRGAPGEVIALYAAAQELRPAAVALAERVIDWIPDDLADVITLLEHDVAQDEVSAEHVLDGLRRILRSMSLIARREPELAPLVAPALADEAQPEGLEGKMARMLDDLTEAEWQLLMIQREGAREGLKIKIIGESGSWAIRLGCHKTARSGDGRGHDFSSAWHDIVDPRLGGGRAC